MSDPAGQAAAAPRVSAGAPTLDYSAPRVFFAADYFVRLRDLLIAFVAAFAFAVAFGFFAWMSAGRAPRWFTVGFGLVPLACGAVMCAVVWEWATVHKRTLRITDEGVEYDGKRLPWRTVLRFYGKRQWSRVLLTVDAGTAIVKLPKELHVTPNPTQSEYVALANALSRYLAEAFPNIRVERQPITDTE